MKIKTTAIFLALVALVGCERPQPPVVDPPKLVLIDGDTHIACRSGVSIVPDGPGYRVSFTESRPFDNFPADFHSVRNVCVVQLNKYSARSSADPQLDQVYRACFGDDYQHILPDELQTQQQTCFTSRGERGQN